MISQRLLANLYIAISAVITNKVRSLLTALGIIFGVAAVIAMLAIGNGAQQEILDQIRLVGVNNIVIKPIVEQKEEKVEEGGGASGKEKKKFSPGLTVRDLKSITETIPGLNKVSPEVSLETNVIRNGYRRSAKLVGVDPAYFEIYNFPLTEGQHFSAEHRRVGAPVCIIGYGIKTKFFPVENPIGKSIKVGPHWLTIIGVLEERKISSNSIGKLGIRDFNMDVYTPLETVLIRYRDRDKITTEGLRLAAMRSRGNIQDDPNQSAEQQAERKNYHQLDRLVIQVDESKMMAPVADIIQRMLQRKHYDVIDYEIEIPELLLKQQQRTNDIFNYVLGAIAGISLLVGGIGIMNIMLASVLERIKEIGLRLSIGAQKSDIIQQFLFEAMMISVSGGLIGVVLGVSMAYIVSTVAGIQTIVSFASIVLSFGVAATVGLVFGIAPARKAANQDPIASLRYE